MTCKSLTLKIALLCGLFASMSAMASPTFTMRIPLRELAISTSSGSASGGTTGTDSSGTVSPSGTGDTATPVESAPEPTAPHVPQQYTLNPGMNETFSIPADATNQSYYWYVKPDSKGQAKFDAYQDDVLVWSGGGIGGGWTGTATATSVGFKIFPGHTYRFNVTIGTLYASKLTYTQ